MILTFQLLKIITRSNKTFLPKALVPSASFSFMAKSMPNNYSFASSQKLHPSNTNQEDLSILQGIFGQKLSDVQEIMNDYTSCTDLNLLKPDDQEWITTVLSNLMKAHQSEGNPEKSSQYRTELEDFLNNTDTRITFGTVNCYHFLAIEYLGLQDFSKAERYATNANEIGKMLDENRNIRSLLIHNLGVLASSYLRTNQEDKALELYQTVLANSANVLDYTLPTLLINAYDGLLEIYSRRKDMKKISEYAKKHLDVAIERYGKYSEEILPIYYHVPFVLTDPEYFNEVLGYAEKALQLSIELYSKDSGDVALIYSSLFGMIYKSNQNYVKALEYYEKAIQILENLSQKSPKLQKQVYSLAAEAHQALGNQQEADNYLKKSSEIISS